MSTAGWNLDDLDRNLSYLSDLDRDLSDLDRDLPHLDRDLPVLDRDLSDLDRDLSDLDRDLSDLDRDLPHLDRDLPDLDRDLPDLDRDLSDLDGDLSDLDGDLSDLDHDHFVRRAKSLMSNTHKQLQNYPGRAVFFNGDSTVDKVLHQGNTIGPLETSGGRVIEKNWRLQP